MTRLHACVLLSVVALGLPAARAADEKPVPAQPSFTAPSAREFEDLRLAYSRAGFAGWDHDEARKAVVKALQEKRIAEFLELSAAWLERVPVDMAMHFVRASTLSEIGDFAAAMRHRYMAAGLLHSIVGTADGKTCKTGFKVFAIAEEQMVLQALGAQVRGRSVVDHCDEMKVMVDGKEQTIYFDITAHMDQVPEMFR